MTEDPNSNNPDASYSERLVCFIDLLGFGNLIDQSSNNHSSRLQIYTMLNELQAGKLVDALYEGVPVLASDGRFVSASQGCVVDVAKSAFPLSITQFSDSFVISCPANNFGSCSLLLRTIYAVKRLFFRELELLMRGGLAKGLLIHEQGGVLFGPAMNEAYSLESKSAIYPRVLVSHSAAEHLERMFKDDELLRPMFQSFDGFNAIDMVSLLGRTHTKPDEVAQFKPKLDAIETDILKNGKNALPKVRYLQDRWLRSQDDVNSSSTGSSS
jgi:hypothetical protein